MVVAIAGFVSSNELEAQTKKVRRYIGDATKDGRWTTRSDITRRFQDISRKTRDEILQTIEESGYIEQRSEKRDGVVRPVQYFRQRVD